MLLNGGFINVANMFTEVNWIPSYIHAIHKTDFVSEIIQSGCFKSKEMIARTKNKKALQTKHQTNLR